MKNANGSVAQYATALHNFAIAKLSDWDHWPAHRATPHHMVHVKGDRVMRYFANHALSAAVAVSISYVLFTAVIV
ncbi:hypothetical protein FHS61_001330 [Altererythrobacter atlanticus]|uniref:hypothetical protein n=1 Tax=Croceibacterium atlanticum TaxID=1267766 RepID=UPI0012E16DE9|nr:hypothetical protein [Croceibacterium atlanticum]MBB5732321.1 hypothetical protein [Croceibacterium atlanticum]